MTLFEKPVGLLSVDVEDWFHLIGAGLDYQFRCPPGGIETWDTLPERASHNVKWLLDTFDSHQVKATFFVLGWIAERHPELVRQIHARGHEIASHGYNHKVLSRQTPNEFREDVRRSLEILQNITHEKILGFRCSSASITEWAIEVLGEEGLLYDSSLFPATYHDVYGQLEGTDPFKPVERLRNGLWEVKFSSLIIGKFQLPWSGGGYFRLLPYWLFRYGLHNILKKQGVFSFYIHPWEVDASAPRLTNLKLIYHFRRYVSLNRTSSRLQKLLSDFSFIPIKDFLQNYTYTASAD